MGQIVDLKDRLPGAFRYHRRVGSVSSDGDGMASPVHRGRCRLLPPGARLKEEDLTTVRRDAGKLKALIDVTKSPLFCAVVGFDSLPAIR